MRIPAPFQGVVAAPLQGRRGPAHPGSDRPRAAHAPLGSRSYLGDGFPMTLSQREQQILDEIQRGIQAQDPQFFASMAGSRSRHVQPVWGPVMFLFGLAASC